MKELTKGRQIFLYAAPFPAMAFFKFWAASGRSPESLLIVSSAVFFYCALIIGLAMRWDKPTYFDWVFAAYFLTISSALALWPSTASKLYYHYSVTGIYVCLFSAAFFPPLFGLDPFTYHYARKSTPAIYWKNPIFIRINRIMTYVWAGIFAIAIALSFYPLVVTRALIPVALICLIGLPFNALFPDFYLKRLGLPSLSEQRKLAQKETLYKGKEDFGFSKETEMGKTIESSGISQKKRKENVMKVLAFNSSPRTGGESKTELMLTPLVQGMKDAGAAVEVVELRKKKVNLCAGCFTCWTKTPGVCIHKDDMTSELFPKWIDADLVIYATPLYHFTMNAELKAFIERTLPVLQPFFEEDHGRTHHPMRHQHPKLVMLSVAGFPEAAIFSQLSSWFNFIYKEGGYVAGEIYRPNAEAMTLPYFKEKSEEILNAVRQAGTELIEKGNILPETMERIEQPVSEDNELFRKIGNLFWKACLAEGITPKEFSEKEYIPRPDSLETFLLIMSMGFNPDRAADLSAVMQFNFSGPVDGCCYLSIKEGTIDAQMGSAEKPDLTIDTPFDVWMDIMTKKADGQALFMEQAYTTKGDLSLLMRMNQLFSG